MSCLKANKAIIITPDYHQFNFELIQNLFLIDKSSNLWGSLF